MKLILKNLPKSIFSSLVIVSFLFLACSAPEKAEMRFPGDEWEVMANPAEEGWSLEGLQAVREATEELDTAVMMFIHWGKVVDSWGEVHRAVIGEVDCPSADVPDFWDATGFYGLLITMTMIKSVKYAAVTVGFLLLNLGKRHAPIPYWRTDKVSKRTRHAITIGWPFLQTMK